MHPRPGKNYVVLVAVKFTVHGHHVSIPSIKILAKACGGIDRAQDPVQGVTAGSGLVPRGNRAPFHVARFIHRPERQRVARHVQHGRELLGPGVTVHGPAQSPVDGVGGLVPFEITLSLHLESHPQGHPHGQPEPPLHLAGIDTPRDVYEMENGNSLERRKAPVLQDGSGEIKTKITRPLKRGINTGYPRILFSKFNALSINCGSRSFLNSWAQSWTIASSNFSGFFIILEILAAHNDQFIRSPSVNNIEGFEFKYIRSTPKFK
jgi:hypothetical protein